MLIEPEEKQVIIVLIGNFNPTIFHPAWFRETGVFSVSEAEAMKIDFMHPEIATLSGEWFSLQVQKDRFTLRALQPPYVQVNDLVLRIFGEFLTHTPIKKLGINLMVQFSVKDFDTQYKLGRALAPIEAWGDWAKELDKRTDTQTSGMRRLLMEQHIVDDRPPGFGFVQASIEPGDKPATVKMNVCDDYRVSDIENEVGATAVMEILENSFDRSMERSEKIIDGIMNLSRSLES